MTYNDVHNIIRAAARRIVPWKPNLLVAIGEEPQDVLVLFCPLLIHLQGEGLCDLRLLSITSDGIICFVQRLFPSSCFSVSFHRPSCSSCLKHQKRTFLKDPETKRNIPIFAIGLSLYESLPGTTAEQVGNEVIRTQWLCVYFFLSLKATWS